MKKLMLAFGAIALAATVQAANFRWYNSSPISPAGDTSGIIASGTVYLFSGSGQADLLSGYVAAIAAGTADTYFSSASGLFGTGTLTDNSKFSATTVTGASVDTSGRITWSETTTDATRSYYEVFVSGDNVYLSDTVTTSVKGTGNTNFAFSGNESRTALKQASDGYSGGGWYAVPEPTSGLLMLLGMAGLALKRKRA